MNKPQEALKMAIEALEDANNVVFQEWSIEGEYNDALQACKEALAELQEHDNEVIEMCAEVCDEHVEFFGCAELPSLHERERDTAKALASQIRALKEQI